MFILITVALLVVTSLIVLLLRIVQPGIRYSWMIAAGGGLLAWLSVLVWRSNTPSRLEFSIWQPVVLFTQSPAFATDSISRAFALSTVTLGLSVIITSVVRSNFPSPLSWSGTLLLCSLGVLAVAADNPITLVLVWAALDLVELTVQLRFVEDPNLTERVVIAFASRATGTMVLLWATISNTSSGFNVEAAAPNAGIFLLIAAALRIGVLPLHLPYPSESALRRGFGTVLRMVSASSSLILLTRIPAQSISSSLASVLLLLVSFAAVYGGWMWLRAPNELTGRPFWIIGVGSLAVASALRGEPAGAVAWSCALVLCGGALFLSSEPNKWLVRSLWIAAFGFSSLPFSLSATGWVVHGFFLAWIPLIASHAMLLAGFIRHIQRPPASLESFDDQPLWARSIFPAGIFLLLGTTLLLGLYGWDGSLQFGNLLAGTTASLLTFGLVWFTPRLRILNPVRAHWVRPTNVTWLDGVYQSLWNLYRQLGRFSTLLSSVLEGESGIMWTLLFLALFISLFIQRVP